MSYSGGGALGRAWLCARPSTAHTLGEGPSSFQQVGPGRAETPGPREGGVALNRGVQQRQQQRQRGVTAIRVAEEPAELEKAVSSPAGENTGGGREAVAGRTLREESGGFSSRWGYPSPRVHTPGDQALPPPPTPAGSTPPALLKGNLRVRPFTGTSERGSYTPGGEKGAPELGGDSGVGVGAWRRKGVPRWEEPQRREGVQWGKKGVPEGVPGERVLLEEGGTKRGRRSQEGGPGKGGCMGGERGHPLGTEGHPDEEGALGERGVRGGKGALGGEEVSPQGKKGASSRRQWSEDSPLSEGDGRELPRGHLPWESLVGLRGHSGEAGVPEEEGTAWGIKRALRVPPPFEHPFSIP